MPSSVTQALQRECYISPSQEEVLANLGGGWERSVHFVLDDTPSQHVPLMANVVAPAIPNESETVSAGSTSDSDDDDFHVGGFTQEPVEWCSPPSSSTHGENAKEHANIVMEESYNAAFESDRSQSPLNEPVRYPEPEGVSNGAESDGEPIMEPDSGAMHIQPLAPMYDEEIGVMHSQPLMCDGETGVLHSQPLMGDGETGVWHSQPLVEDGETGETEDQGAMEDACKSQPKLQKISEIQLSSASTHCWCPTTVVNHTRHEVFELMSAQPITQPAYETQPSESPMEEFTIPLRSRPYFVEPDEELQRERSTDKIAPADEQLLSGKSTDDLRTNQDVPQSTVAAAPDIEQGIGADLAQCGEIRTDATDIERSPSKLKRRANFEELDGQERRQRVEGSTSRVRRCPKTNQDVPQSTVAAAPDIEQGSGADLAQCGEIRTDETDIERSPSKLKRRANFEELNGQERRQRVEGSTSRVRRSPKTIQDVPQSTVAAAPDIEQGSGADLAQCGEIRTDETDIERSPSKLKRRANFEELNGQERRQRVEGSTSRVRRSPKTIQDVPQSTVAAAPDIEQGSGADLAQCGEIRTDETDIESSPSKLKRRANFEELNGQEKRQRVEGSTSRVRRCPKTVMDVVRSRSTPMSSPSDEDDRNILRVLMRAGVSFPPLVYTKHSV